MEKETTYAVIIKLSIMVSANSETEARIKAQDFIESETPTARLQDLGPVINRIIQMG